MLVKAFETVLSRFSCIAIRIGNQPKLSTNLTKIFRPMIRLIGARYWFNQITQPPLLFYPQTSLNSNSTHSPYLARLLLILSAYV